MSTHVFNLSLVSKEFATYGETTAIYYTDPTTSYPAKWDPTSIVPPTWNNARKAFAGYFYTSGGTDYQYVYANGSVNTGADWSSAHALTERWETIKYAAVVYSQSSAVAEIVHDNGTWWSDYRNLVPLDAEHPIEIPRRECYRFIGCYSTNGTTGTKYINADGTPTAAFLDLTPSRDVTIYAQWELAAVKITINASYGDFAFKTFYQSLTADDEGFYGYYTDGYCSPESRIYGIPIPTRELYDWNGAHKSSSSSSTLYIDGGGDFTEDFLARDPAATTIYGSFWEQLTVKLTVNANGGTASVTTYYLGKNSGCVFDYWLTYEANELSELPLPSRPGYRFLGYYSSSSGGTLYVAADGTIQPALDARTTATTIYAMWRQLSTAVTLDDGGGSGGSGSIYYDDTAGDASFVNATGAAIQSVAVPSYVGNVFNGYYDADEGGTKCIEADGSFSAGFAPSSSVTLYAQYTIGKCEITVERGEGEGGVEMFFYDIAAGAFFADGDLTEEIDALDLPTRHLFGTDGLFTEQTGGTRLVEADGSFSAGWTPSGEFVTIYAQYTRRCFEVALDAGGGSCAYGAIYHAPSAGGAWYSDEFLTTPITNVGATTRTGYVFGGFSYDGVTIIGTDGAISSAEYVGNDYTAAAEWTAKTFTLYFSAPGSVVQLDSKSVTYGSPIGTLPVARIDGKIFESWTVSGTPITAETIWETDADATATAVWRDYFSNLTDYFSLAAADGPLMLVESSDGATRSVTETTGSTGTGANLKCGVLAITTGDSAVGAFARGGILLNPTCTYRIRRPGTIQLRLGKAYGMATVSGIGTKANPYRATRSGYMLANAEYSTAADGEPVLTVRGAANEGYVWNGSTMRAQLTDAINIWTVTLAVSPDHIAQDPMSAIVGGGELTECRTLVTCDPIVPTEGGMPCASDVVRGKVVVTVTTAAYFGEDAPSAGGFFVETSGVPPNGSDVDFTTYAMTAERSL